MKNLLVACTAIVVSIGLLGGCNKAIKESLVRHSVYPQPLQPDEAVQIEADAANAQTCDGFVGQSISPVSFDSVISSVSRLPREKDEFETTAQFEARVTAALGGILSTYIISAQFNAKYAVYDADRQMFTIKSYAIHGVNTSWGAVFGYGSTLYNKVNYSMFDDNVDLVLSSKETVVDRYKGSNAFRASATISKIDRNVRAIFDRKAKSGENLFFTTTIAEIAANLTNARALKDSFGAAVVVKPKAPWFARGTKNWGSPTINSPRDIDENVTALIADIQCALIIDGTNTVLAAVTTR